MNETRKHSMIAILVLKCMTAAAAAAAAARMICIDYYL